MTALADGEMKACVVQGIDVLICHVDGRYYAVGNACSHAGQKLSTGQLDGFELHCPLHRASFDIRTGAALAAPATTAISSYPVTLSGGKVNAAVSG
jgi:nitrite reductase/ring-hydroxylating ferredoxin subunit